MRWWRDPHRGYSAASLKKKKNQKKPILCIEVFKGKKKNANPGSHSQPLETLPLQVNPRARKINIQEH